MRRSWLPAVLVLALALGGLSAWWVFGDRTPTGGGPTPSGAAEAPAKRATPEVDPRDRAATDAATKPRQGVAARRTATADDAAFGRVSGAVRRPDGSPVAGARVTARDEAGAETAAATRAEAGAASGAGAQAGADAPANAAAQAVTDAAGRYSLTRLSPGVYRIAAEAPGLRADAREAVAARAGELTAGVDLTLDPGARILGLVRVLGDGHPLAGVTVRVHDRTALSGRRFSQATELRTRSPERSTTTKKNGRFEVAGLAPGKKLVTAKAPGYKTSAQVAVELPEGGSQTVEIVLETGLFIAGRVTDPQGAPVSGAAVEADPARRRGPFGRGATTDEGGKATTGADGRYRLGGLSGSRFTVTARAPGRGLAEAKERRVRPGRSDVDLQLSAGASISGRVVEAGSGAPIAGAEVRASMGSFGLGGHRATRTGSDGAFAFSELEEGGYDVEARAGGLAPASQLVTIRAGDSKNDVTLVLSTGGRVAGMVVDGSSRQPVAGARVMALPDGNPVQQRMQRMMLEASAAPGGLPSGMPAGLGAGLAERMRTTDREGRFTLDGLKEGGYLVVAADASHPAGEARAQVRAGEETGEITIELPPAGTLRGTVKNATGAVVGGAQVSAFSMTGGFRSGETDERGRFELQGLRPGSFLVNVRVPDDADVPGTFRGQTIDLEAGRVARVDLRAELSVKVRARAVRGNPPEPVADKTVRVMAKAGGMLFKSARTDGAGRFEIELPPGAYLFGVGSYGQTVQVPATGEVVDVVLAIPGAHARGQVVDAQGGAPLPASVTLYRKQPGQAADTFAGVLSARAGRAQASKETGAFEVSDLAPGDYVLAARMSGYGEKRVDVTVPASGDLEGLVVTLEKGMVLSGLVVDPAGKPVPRPTAWVRDVSAPGVPGGRPPTGDEDGRFRLDQLAAGSYILTVLTDGFAPWRRAVTVTDGQPEQIVDVQLQAGGSIDLILTRGGQPALGARVEIRYPQGDRVVTGFMDFIQSFIPTSAEGHVRRSRMPPGTLTGTAYLPGPGESRLAEARFTVSVQEGQETQVTIDLPGE